MFESESGTAPGVQLSTILDRMEIRKAVQAGQVEEAIDKVNDLNPEVRYAVKVLIKGSADSTRVSETAQEGSGSVMLGGVMHHQMAAQWVLGMVCIMSLPV
jgi:hypothetical protein